MFIVVLISIVLAVVVWLSTPTGHRRRNDCRCPRRCACRGHLHRR